MRSTYIVLRIPGFYAQIEKAKNPLLVERPVVVCAGAGQRAIVLSACPHAAALGVHPGVRLADLPVHECEIVSFNPDKYEDGNRFISTLLENELPEITLLRPGIFSAHWRGGTAFLSSSVMHARLALAHTGFTGFWGVSGELACAEIAASIAGKGDVLEIPRGQERAFLAPLPLSLLPDLGPRHLTVLREMGVQTFGDLARIPKSALRRLFGPEGPLVQEIALHGRRPALYRQWRGVRRLREDAEDPAVLYAALADLVARGIDEITSTHHYPGTLLLTIVYADRRRTTGAIRPVGMLHEGHWQAAAQSLANELWKRRVRIGEIRISIPYGPPQTRQLGLFVPVQRQERDHRLTGAVHHIRRRLGENAVHFASAAFPPSRTMKHHRVQS